MIANKLKERMDAHLRETKTKEERKRFYLYASDVHSCQRKIALEFQGVQGDPWDVTLLKVFDMGNDVHNRIQKYFEEMGVLVSKELDVPRGPENVHGRYDCIIELEGEKIVVEIKSINMRAVKEPMEHHVAQMMWYMHQLNLKKGIILYESKQTQEHFFFEFDYDEKLYQETLAWFQQTNDILAKRAVPEVPKGYGKDKYPCANCKYRRHCYGLKEPFPFTKPVTVGMGGTVTTNTKFTITNTGGGLDAAQETKDQDGKE